MKNIFAILVFLAISVIGFSQNIVTMTGSCRLREAGSDYQKALDIAIERAKLLAVSEVYGEDVSLFLKSETSDKQNSLLMKYKIDSYGVVRVLESPDIWKKGGAVYARITGEVIKPDTPISIKVNDFKRVYTNNQHITFGVSFYRDSYLKIFWFDEQTGEGGILYPQPKSFNERFIGDNRLIEFPLYGDINYFKKICPEARTEDDLREEWIRNGKISSGRKITKEDLPKPRGGGWHPVGQGNKHAEKNVAIVFVTTNSNIPYSFSDVNEEKFMEWWSCLPCSEKSIPIEKHITLRM